MSRTIRVSGYQYLTWLRVGGGATCILPVKVDWPELRLTLDQITANSLALAAGEEPLFPDHTLINIEIDRGPMKVWVVTIDDYSNEGLEGAFDCYVGIARTAAAALDLLHEGRTYGRKPWRHELTMVDETTARVTLWTTWESMRTNHRTMEQYVHHTSESEGDHWTIREVEL